MCWVTHLPASSTTVASMNSVDLSLTMTWQSSTSGDATFSSSSSFEPDAVFVGASSGIMREPLLLQSNVVSASLLVCAIFSMTLPPVVKSAMFGFRAALCFFARILSACVSFFVCCVWCAIVGVLLVCRKKWTKDFSINSKILHIHHVRAHTNGTEL